MPIGHIRVHQLPSLFQTLKSSRSQHLDQPPQMSPTKPSTSASTRLQRPVGRMASGIPRRIKTSEDNKENIPLSGVVTRSRSNRANGSSPTRGKSEFTCFVFREYGLDHHRPTTLASNSLVLTIFLVSRRHLESNSINSSEISAGTPSITRAVRGRDL